MINQLQFVVHACSNKTVTAECATKYRSAGQGGPGSCPHHARVPGHGTQEEEQLELASWMLPRPPPSCCPAAAGYGDTGWRVWQIVQGPALCHCCRGLAVGTTFSRLLRHATLLYYNTQYKHFEYKIVGSM